MENCKSSGNIVASLFIIIPIIFVILGLWFFPYPISEEVRELLPIPLFGSLAILAIGFIFRKQEITHKVKITGWIIFAFFWSTQPKNLYFSEEGDFVNAFLAMAGVFLFFYIAYHEWLSIKRKENISCLNWVAGLTALAGLIYFCMEMTPLEMWLREVVAAQSAWLLNIFTGNVTQSGIHISWNLAHITIIFACTAVQSMVLFIGLIVPLPNVDAKRKAYGLLVTVVPIYFLNLIRNAGVIYLVGVYGSGFFPTAHNIIGKGGSLIALVILVFVVIKIIPEVFDEILALTDLPKRNGPLEKGIKRIIGRKT